MALNADGLRHAARSAKRFCDLNARVLAASVCDPLLGIEDPESSAYASVQGIDLTGALFADSGYVESCEGHRDLV